MKKKVVALLCLVVILASVATTSTLAVCSICGASTTTTYGDTWRVFYGEDIRGNEMWWIWQVRTSYIVRCNAHPGTHVWTGIERFLTEEFIGYME